MQNAPLAPRVPIILSSSKIRATIPLTPTLVFTQGKIGVHLLLVTGPSRLPFHRIALQTRFENFRKQSESNMFNLSHGSLSHFSGNGGVAQPSTLQDVPDQGHRRRHLPAPKSQHMPSGAGEHVENSEGINLDESSPRHKLQPLLKTSHCQETAFFDTPQIQSPANVSSSNLSRVQAAHSTFSPPQPSRTSRAQHSALRDTTFLNQLRWPYNDSATRFRQYSERPSSARLPCTGPEGFPAILQVSDKRGN